MGLKSAKLVVAATLYPGAHYIGEPEIWSVQVEPSGYRDYRLAAPRWPSESEAVFQSVPLDDGRALQVRWLKPGPNAINLVLTDLGNGNQHQLFEPVTVEAVNGGWNDPSGTGLRIARAAHQRASGVIGESYDYLTAKSSWFYSANGDLAEYRNSHKPGELDVHGMTPGPVPPNQGVVYWGPEVPTCNVFVYDAIFDANLEPPLNDVDHYYSATATHNRFGELAQLLEVVNEHDVAVGDILAHLKPYPHVELVASPPRDDMFAAMGAHKRGAYLKMRTPSGWRFLRWKGTKPLPQPEPKTPDPSVMPHMGGQPRSITVAVQASLAPGSGDADFNPMGLSGHPCTGIKQWEVVLNLVGKREEPFEPRPSVSFGADSPTAHYQFPEPPCEPEDPGSKPATQLYRSALGHKVLPQESLWRVYATWHAHEYSHGYFPHDKASGRWDEQLNPQCLGTVREGSGRRLVIAINPRHPDEKGPDPCGLARHCWPKP